MTGPLPIGLPQLSNRIGRLQGALPDLLGGLQGVVIYADWSRSLSSEVFEARGLAGFPVVGFGAEFCRFQLRARTPGGSVCEFVVLSGGTNVSMQILEAPADVWSFGPVTRAPMSCGGVPIADSVRDGRVAAGGIGYSLVPILTVPFGDRWFIPPGFTLDVISNTAGVGLTYCVQWRELAGFTG